MVIKRPGDLPNKKNGIINPCVNRVQLFFDNIGLKTYYLNNYAKQKF